LSDPVRSKEPIDRPRANPRKRLPLGSHNHFVDHVPNVDGKPHLDVFEVISPTGKVLVGYYNMKDGYGTRGGLSGEQAAMVEASRLGGYNKIDIATARRVWPFGEARVFPVEVGPDNRGSSVALPTKHRNNGAANPKGRWGNFKKGTRVHVLGDATEYRYVKLAPASDFSRAYGKQAIIRLEGGTVTRTVGLDDIAPLDEYVDFGWGSYGPPRRANPHVGSAKGDKAVIRAFTEQKPASSKKLHTDGHRLDGLWMGGNNLAEWTNGQIVFHDIGSKAAERVQKMIRKEAPKNDLAEGWTRGSKKNVAKAKSNPNKYASFVKSQMPGFRAKGMSPKAAMSAIAREWRAKKAMN
jgi:hypothetical protein